MREKGLQYLTDKYLFYVFAPRTNNVDGPEQAFQKSIFTRKNNSIIFGICHLCMNNRQIHYQKKTFFTSKK